MFQPKVQPLAPGIDLTSQTALVTGATAGIGQAIAKHLLQLKLSTLIIAARNPASGESTRQALQSINPKAKIHVLKLDMDDYDSIKAFLAQINETTDRLDIAMLNAGLFAYDKTLSGTGHETCVQVNYLSNVFLSVGLMPLLESTSKQTGRPSRLTWTGSEVHYSASLMKTPIPKGKGLIQFLDEWDPGCQQTYANSKLLVALFQYELRKHYTNTDRVIINHFCPGMVYTSLARTAPAYIIVPYMFVMKRLKMRTTETAAIIALNTALVTGKETHGEFLKDKELRKPIPFLDSEQGQKLTRVLWNETIDELQPQTNLPSWIQKI